jgi:hypothetical protein
VDHSEGSKIELFFTGDPLDDSSRQNIYSNAAKYGIEENRVFINDHSSQSKGNEIEFIKGFYERMDKEISSRDADIKRLQDELKATKSIDIPYVQITREIINSYPDVSNVHITQGASVRSDSLKVHQSILVMVKASAPFAPGDSAKLNDWLKIRMNNESVILIVAR